VTQGMAPAPLQSLYPTSPHWLAPDRILLQGTKTPSSRGASCPPLDDPCPLTDGDPTPVSIDGGTQSLLFVFHHQPSRFSRVVIRAALANIDVSVPLTLTVQVGPDTLAQVELTPQPMSLSDYTVRQHVFLQRLWLNVDLGRQLSASAPVVLSFSHKLYSVGEVSFFDE
jgi:hypothetical protein